MKKLMLIVATFFSVFVFSCKNEVKNNEAEDSHEETDSVESDQGNPQVSCYQYVTEKDTVTLRLENIDNDVAGTLSYGYFDKDKNDGTIEGTMKGDTLYVDYTFVSAGQTSVREVVFLNKNNKMIEGYADVEDLNGKVQFKDGAKFTFNENMPLEKVDCNDD